MQTLDFKAPNFKYYLQPGICRGWRRTATWGWCCPSWGWSGGWGGGGWRWWRCSTSRGAGQTGCLCNKMINQRKQNKSLWLLMKTCRYLKHVFSTGLWWYLNLILFSVISSTLSDPGPALPILDLKMVCIFSVMADMPSCRMGSMNTLKEERLAVSREPQTSRPMRLVQTLLWSNLWANLDTEADISQEGEETWCHHQLLHSPTHDSLSSELSVFRAPR